MMVSASLIEGVFELEIAVIIKAWLLILVYLSSQA